MNISCIFGFHKWDGCKCNICGKMTGNAAPANAVLDLGKVISFVESQSAKLAPVDDYYVFKKKTVQALLTHLWRIKSGGNINAKDDEGQTALAYAIKLNYGEIVTSLLDGGAGINVKNRYGFTALMLAAKEGHREIAGLLLDCDADIQARSNEDWSVLMFAACDGHTEIVKMLLDRGADINAKEGNDRTALISAAFWGDTETVRLLVQRGADFRLRDSKGKTALMYATERGFTAVAEILKAAEHDTPSDATAAHKKSLPDVEASKREKEQKKAVKQLELLTKHLKRIKEGGDINAKDDYEKTALMYATEANRLDDVQRLLQLGACPNSTDEDGYSALMIAAENNHEDVAKILLAAGANINLKSTYNWTALMVAALKGHLEMVRLLLENGADVDAQNDGTTSLAFAKMFCYEKVVVLLKEYGATK